MVLAFFCFCNLGKTFTMASVVDMHESLSCYLFHVVIFLCKFQIHKCTVFLILYSEISCCNWPPGSCMHLYIFIDISNLYLHMFGCYPPDV